MKMLVSRFNDSYCSGATTAFCASFVTVGASQVLRVPRFYARLKAKTKRIFYDRIFRVDEGRKRVLWTRAVHVADVCYGPCSPPSYPRTLPQRHTGSTKKNEPPQSYP